MKISIKDVVRNRRLKDCWALQVRSIALLICFGGGGGGAVQQVTQLRSTGYQLVLSIVCIPHGEASGLTGGLAGGTKRRHLPDAGLVASAAGGRLEQVDSICSTPLNTERAQRQTCTITILILHPNSP